MQDSAKRFIPDATRAGDPSTVAFVVCIEAGKMEEMALRLVTSLRKWGGAFAMNEVLAVNPRRGAALQPVTRNMLRSLGVNLIERPSASPVPWFPIYNKAVAVRIADHEANADIICFLDTDTLVLNAPELFALPADCDFRACPLNRSCASRGPSDPNEPYWRIASNSVGASLDDMGWVRDYFDKHEMRMYFNSGVFAFRRGLGFGDAYAEDFMRVLNCGYRSPTSGIYNTSQVTLPLTVHRLGMQIECLPISHHTPITSDRPTPECESALPHAKLVHYFRSMTFAQFDKFVSLISQSHLEVGEWLAEKGPIGTRQRAVFRLINKPLYEWRRWRYRRFEERCLIP